MPCQFNSSHAGRGCFSHCQFTSFHGSKSHHLRRLRRRHILSLRINVGRAPPTFDASLNYGQSSDFARPLSISCSSSRDIFPIQILLVCSHSQHMEQLRHRTNSDESLRRSTSSSASTTRSMVTRTGHFSSGTVNTVTVLIYACRAQEPFDAERAQRHPFKTYNNTLYIFHDKISRVNLREP